MALPVIFLQHCIDHPFSSCCSIFAVFKTAMVILVAADSRGYIYCKKKGLSWIIKIHSGNPYKQPNISIYFLESIRCFWSSVFSVSKSTVKSPVNLHCWVETTSDNNARLVWVRYILLSGSAYMEAGAVFWDPTRCSSMEGAHQKWGYVGVCGV